MAPAKTINIFILRDVMLISKKASAIDLKIVYLAF